MNELFRVMIESADQVTVVRVAGELDPETAPLLDDAFSGRDRIVADLSGVTLIGSAGLATLLAAHERCAGAGGSFQLAAPSAVVSRVLRISGMEEHLQLIDSVRS